MSKETRLRSVLEEHRYYDRQGAFYSGVAGRPLGSGIIVGDCMLPFFDKASKQYLTGRGYACVLSHECDIDPSNERFFNDKALVIPIINFFSWFELVWEGFSQEKAVNVSKSIVQDDVYRVFYLPVMPEVDMEFGGLLYLNEATSVAVEPALTEANLLCSLTSFSHNLLDWKLQNHLFRSKAMQVMYIH